MKRLIILSLLLAVSAYVPANAQELPSYTSPHNHHDRTAIIPPPRLADAVQSKTNFSELLANYQRYVFTGRDNGVEGRRLIRLSEAGL